MATATCTVTENNTPLDVCGKEAASMIITACPIGHMGSETMCLAHIEDVKMLLVDCWVCDVMRGDPEMPIYLLHVVHSD